eukprot:11677298-Ditylum_brightwellii.AAC.1
MKTKPQSFWHMYPGSGLETSAMTTSCAKDLLTALYGPLPKPWCMLDVEITGEERERPKNALTSP